MKCEGVTTDLAPVATQRDEINYANIIRAYIAHVLDQEGTHFICYDEDIETLSLSDAEAAELARLRDEVDAIWEQS